MARTTAGTQKEENREVSARTDASRTTGNVSERGEVDRERSIEVRRDRPVSRGFGTTSSLTPVYGPTATPFALMRRVAEDMDQLFQNLGFGSTGLGLTSRLESTLDQNLWSDIGSQTMWAPPVETFKRGDHIVIRADLPGVNKDDVKVEIDDGVLAISGERREVEEENRGDFYRSERRYGSFYRAIPLPEGINREQCEAAFKDGTLEVTLPAPKEPERKATQIPIR